MGAPTFPKKPFNVIVTLDRHAGLFVVPPSPVPVPGFGWHIGGGLEVVSKAIWSDKWNNDVQVDGQPICSVGNAVGLILPHWPVIAPSFLNLYVPILMALSSSTSFMAVGSIVAKQGPIAVTIPYVRYVGTNLACNDPVPLPSDIVVHTGSSVVMGFTWGDLLAAAVRWGVSIVVAYVTKGILKAGSAAARRGATWAGTRIGNRATSAIAQRLSRGLGTYGQKGFPGLAKGAFNRALGRTSIPKAINKQATAGETPLDRFFGQKYLDDLFGLPKGPRVGQFESVAERLGGQLPPPVRTAFSSGLLTNPLSAGTSGLSGDIGSYVDSRSEHLP